MLRTTRNKLALFLIVLIFCAFMLFQFGIQMGSVQIGKQSNLQSQQQDDFENSHFYKQYYLSDSLLILNYWATWCKPCIAEMPMLNEVKLQFIGEKVAFISISVDTDSTELKNFLDAEIFEFTDITLDNQPYRTAIMNVLRGKEPSEWIGSYSVPVTYFVKNKKVVEVIDGVVGKGEFVEIIDKYK